MTKVPSLTLFHIAPSRSSIVRWMLEEVGQPYRVRLLDPNKGENKESAYLEVNPLGKVPTLIHRGVVISEAAAICCYLADAFPETGIGVPIDDPRRGPYLTWLFFGPSCLEPAVLDRMYPRVTQPHALGVGWADIESILDVIVSSVERGPFLLGEQFTAADVIIGSGLRWAMQAKTFSDRSAITDYVARLEARPALQRITIDDAPDMLHIKPD